MRKKFLILGVISTIAISTMFGCDSKDDDDKTLLKNFEDLMKDDDDSNETQITEKFDIEVNYSDKEKLSLTKNDLKDYKNVKKKDLAAIAMSYGYLYVAQIAQGANPQQCLNAMIEAESYNGPSLIIAYAPCINHGIKGGMSIAQTEEKKAVDAGYWHLFRFDPRRTLEGKNPFILDSKAPTMDYEEFIMGEVRYNSLARSNPERAKELFAKAKKNAEEKYAKLVKLAEAE